MKIPQQIINDLRVYDTAEGFIPSESAKRLNSKGRLGIKEVGI